MIKPYRENAVKIDRATGGLSVSGMPLLPFGFFTFSPVQPTLAGDEVVRGFNLMSPAQVIDKKNLKQRMAYMDRCADLGIRVNYSLSKSEKKEYLRKEIETFRDHPALLAWQIADEPDSYDIPADSLYEIYRLIDELDPYHPVSLLVNSARKARDYTDVMDIVMTNPFIIPQGRIAEYEEYVEILRKAFWLSKPVWVVPQVFGGNEWWLREPTPGEVRAMTYLAIIHGATGVQYYIRSAPNNFPKSAATWNECGELAIEMAELTPDILSPHYAPELMTVVPGIHMKAWNRAGLVTIAVVNDRNEPRPFKINMKDVDITIEADVLFENRKITISEGVIEDIIDGYGTRVYRFDARHRPDQVKGFEPGNLTVDPGFEDLSTAGVPSACTVYGADDPGNSYFIDSRRFYQGEHSLRLNNPSDKGGSRLTFYNIDVAEDKSYTVSIMARTGPSPNRPSKKNDGQVRFRLFLGEAEQTFECNQTWQKYEINAVQADMHSEASARISPQLEMAGKGTAWFDLLQVYPDMQLIERKGGEGNGRIVEISSVHSATTIYYTIDGSEPAAASIPYLGPVEIEQNAYLRAAAFRDGKKVGYIESAKTP
jgi:hypothetical protein